MATQLPPRGEFDEDAYLHYHPDVIAAIQAGTVRSGWQHFTLHGFREGRRWMDKPDPMTGVIREISPADEMYRGNDEHYFDVGASALQCVEAALLAARRPKATIAKILDLPCGHGRVLRFLKKAFPLADLTACDLNRDGVNFCAGRFGASPVLSQADPTNLPLPRDFDLVWCGSLLTHLPLAGCASFLRLFQGLLRPGGILVFTLHGRRCAAELTSGENRCGLEAAQIARLLKDYRQAGFGYVDYSDQAGYGISLAQPSYVLAHFVEQPGWRLLGYHESGWDRRQDVICLQGEQ